MTSSTSPPAVLRPREICGRRTLLPAELAAKASAYGDSPATEPTDVQVDLRCTLAAHPTGDHFALVRDLDGPDTGALWTTWTPGHRPADVIVLADCDAAEPGTGEPCCEFTAHPGAHTFDIADPWTTGLPG